MDWYRDIHVCCCGPVIGEGEGEITGHEMAVGEDISGMWVTTGGGGKYSAGL